MVKLLIAEGVFASFGSSSAAAALCLAQGSPSIFNFNTLIPVGVLCVCLTVIARIAYAKGKDDQKMKSVLKRLENLEKKGKR